MLDFDKLEIQIEQSGKVRCESGWRLSKEWSDQLKDCDLWLVRSGSGVMSTHTQQVELSPGTCIWMRPGGRYIAEQDPENRLSITFVHFSLFEKNYPKNPLLQDLPNEVHYLDPVYTDTLLSRIIDYTNPLDLRPVQPYALQIAEGLLRTILLEMTYSSQIRQHELVSSISSDRLTKLRQIIASIREEPSGDWNISDMSAGINLSPDHFTRIFKKLTGFNPKEFLIEARIQRAKVLLQDQSLPVGEVAEILGYSSLYYFSRQIRKYTGFTPSELRK